MSKEWIEDWRRRLLQPAEGLRGITLLERAAALLALLLLLSAFSVVPDLPVFGHDEAHYYRDFSVRLAEDGRWLNFWLHDFLRSVPMNTWSVLFLASAWLLFYRIARLFAFGSAYAALVASTVVLAYPFAEQVLWPASFLPPLLILLLAGLLVERGLPHPAIYLGAGVLIFGSLQTFYFLLPLLFIRDFLGAAPGGTRWRLLFSHLCWWVAGSVAGVLAMCLLLWLMTGHFGPQPADWRLSNPVHDLPSLLQNTRYVSRAFLDHLELLLRQAGVTKPLLLLLFIVALLRARALLALSPAMLLLAAVALSFFVFCLPLAPLIHQRSLVALAAALLLFLAFLPGSTVLGRVFGVLLLLKLGHGYSIRDEAYLEQHAARVNFFRDKLEQVMPVQPRWFAAIALHGKIDPALPESVTFNDPGLLHPIMMSLGVVKYLDCRVADARCAPIHVEKQLSSLPFAKGELTFSEGLSDEGRVGIIHYRE